MRYTPFRKLVQEYCKVYGFPGQSRKTYENLYSLYNQDPNANCHDDISIDVAQFLDAHHDMLKKEKEVKINYPVMNYATNSFDLCIIDDMISDAPQPVPGCALKKVLPWKKACPIKKEEENSMTINTERQYLNNRLNAVSYTKQDEIYAQFRMGNSDLPKTYKELIDAIKNDKFTLDEKMTKKVDGMADEGYNPYGMVAGIKFDLPDAPDREGHNAAEKAMQKALQTAKDIINTSDAAAGLKALQDFMAWTPEGKTN
jgi:hypothetical protein